jgi:hypothetical protein
LTIARDGTRHEKFGYSEITVGANNPSFTTITPPFGMGYAAIPVDMQKFAGLFLVCVKYHDDSGNRYKQKFVFELAPHLTDTVTRLDEISSSKYHDSICRG